MTSCLQRIYGCVIARLQVRKRCGLARATAVVAGVCVAGLDSANAAELPLTFISLGNFERPTSVEYFEPRNELILTANYPNGDPLNFRRLERDGDLLQFTNVSQIDDEVKLATTRSPEFGGFAGSPFSVGTTFANEETPGRVLKIEPNGTVTRNWAIVPDAATAGVFRGALQVDPTGLFGGDLIGATTSGNIYRIDGSGVGTKVGPATPLNLHFSSVMVVPNEPLVFGPLAGKIIAGAETTGRLYAFGSDNSMSFWQVPVQIEDLDLIPANQNYFGVNYFQNRFLGIAGRHFQEQGLVGKILATQENGGTMHALSWDFTANAPKFEQITLVPPSGGALPQDWQHGTFAPAGVREIRTTFPVPDFTIAGAFGVQKDLEPKAITGTASGRYNYNGGTGTGNPPEATSNKGVMSLVEDAAGILSLMVVLDKTGDATGGSLTLQMSGTGADLTDTVIVVLDDSPTTGDSFSYSSGSGMFTWSWAAGQTDGLLLRLPYRRPERDPLSAWSIQFSTVSSTGLDGFVLSMSGQDIDLGAEGFNFTLAIPEPASVWMLLSAASALAVVRRVRAAM